jgi:hypothetical protein
MRRPLLRKHHDTVIVGIVLSVMEESLCYRMSGGNFASGHSVNSRRLSIT